MLRMSPLLLSSLLCCAPAMAAWPPAPPPTVELSLVDASGAVRIGAIARGGVPLARAQDVRDVARLQLRDAQGNPVPAQFRVLARWNASRDDTSAPIQWLLVDAVVGASGSRYRLVTDAAPGGNPPPAQPLSITQASGRYTIDTGAARFVIDPVQGSLFSEVRRADGTLLASGQAPQLQIGPTVHTTQSVRFARIDEQGPLSATITVEWLSDMPAVGGGGLALRRQYRFNAGSPTALVRAAAAWEGNRCNSSEELTCAAGINGLAVSGMRERLQLVAGGARSVHAFADNDLPLDTATMGAGSSASLRQLQRSDRFQPLAYQLSLPGLTRGGSEADGGSLALSAAGSGAIGIGLARMDHFEPQALRALGPDQLSIDWVDSGSVWIGNHQAVFANLAVAVLPASPSQAQIERDVYAPLNFPLRLWASPLQFAASEAVPEFPVGNLPAAYAGYDALVAQTLDATVTRFDSAGLRGVMTSGLWPSYWGSPLGEQIECGAAGDPTPAVDADDPYWCASWTDYHNASMVGTLAALRAGEPTWFERIGVPAAQRMLHTQMMQCAPNDPWFYCGQAPSGSGGYRSNFNSSHGYFENLILYHFLTGDPWVTDQFARGAATLRAYLCAARGSNPPGPMCGATTPGDNDFVQINDRAANQWYEVFRFLGQTVDASYLTDWRGNIARWLSLHWAQGTAGTQGPVGFIVQSGVGQGLSILAPGAYTTSQLWMASGYDFEQLARLRVVSGDAALGSPALAPSGVIAAWGRALHIVGASAPGNGSAAGVWPNAVDFTWSGSRIGGTISGIAPFWAPDPIPSPCLDACLYDTGKGFMTATLARAADFGGDPALRGLADDFVRHTIERATAADLPLGKETGELLVRLPSAIARLGPPPGESPLFADGFE
jgi:hypothetical protein